MNPNEFIDKNYTEIIKMSHRICKGHIESEEVAHYVISQFLEKKNIQELLNRNEGMLFLSGMIHRNFHSSTSPYHTVYRQKGRVHPTNDQSYYEDIEDDYDYTGDLVISQIERIIQLMKKNKVKLWYNAVLFEMYIAEGNYSEISRQTGIPRTSVSHAVEEAKTYIQEQLKKSGINYE